MARLLIVRGDHLAAGIVAVSSYDAVLVDNWDGASTKQSSRYRRSYTTKQELIVPKRSTRLVATSSPPSIIADSTSH